MLCQLQGLCGTVLATMGKMVKCTEGESQESQKDLPQCSFAGHKSHMDWLGFALGSKWDACP